MGAVETFDYSADIEEVPNRQPLIRASEFVGEKVRFPELTTFVRLLPSFFTHNYGADNESDKVEERRVPTRFVTTSIVGLSEGIGATMAFTGKPLLGGMIYLLSRGLNFFRENSEISRIVLARKKNQAAQAKSPGKVA